MAVGTSMIAPSHFDQGLKASNSCCALPTPALPKIQSAQARLRCPILIEAYTLTPCCAPPTPALPKVQSAQARLRCPILLEAETLLTPSHPAVPYPPLLFPRYRSQHQCAWLDAQPNRYLGGQQPPAATIHAPDMWVQGAAAWQVPHTIRVQGLKYNKSSEPAGIAWLRGRCPTQLA